MAFTTTSYDFHSRAYHNTTGAIPLDSGYAQKEIFLLSEDSIYIKRPIDGSMPIRAKYTVDSSSFNIIITYGNKPDTNRLIKLRNDSLMICYYNFEYWKPFTNSSGINGEYSESSIYYWNNPAGKFDSLKAVFDSSADSISLTYFHGIYARISNTPICFARLPNKSKIASDSPKLVLSRNRICDGFSNYYNLLGRKLKTVSCGIRSPLRPIIVDP